MPRDLVAAYLRWTLGAAPSTVAADTVVKCPCGAQLTVGEQWQAHVLGCVRAPGNGPLKRHNAIRDMIRLVVLSFAKLCEIEPRFAVCNCDCGKKNIPATEWEAHKQHCSVARAMRTAPHRFGPDLGIVFDESKTVITYVDVTIRDALNESHKSQTPAQVFEQAVRDKHASYADLIA